MIQSWPTGSQAGQAIDLDFLGEQGLQIDGQDDGDLLGRSVSSAGDVNGDGRPDIIIGASEANPGISGPAGEAYVLFGGVEPAVYEITELLGENGFLISGAVTGDFAGTSVSGAGDVNGDGLDDVIIGLPGARAEIGDAYVVFGKNDSSRVRLDNLGSEGFRIQGAALGGRLGFSVAGAGDVNGDGLDDLVLGETEADPDGRFSAGKAYVIFGKADRLTVDTGSLGSSGFQIWGATMFGGLGESVSGAGDVNGDGLADVVVAAPDAAVSGDYGVSYVVFGKGSTTRVDLATLGTRGFAMNGSGTSGAVSGAGDINGDGLADLVIGGEDVGSGGAAFVVFGKADSAPVNLFNLGTGGFSVLAIYTGGDLGDAVSGAGDVNGDGLADIILGSPRGDAGPGTEVSGRSFLVFGKSSTSSVDVDNLGDQGIELVGAVGGDLAGRSVSGAGDLNGDGVGDVIIGADSADPDGRINAGSAYVVYSPEAAASIALYSSYAAEGDPPPQPVGTTAAGDAAPPSRMWIDFSDGQAPNGVASLQTAVVYREAGPVSEPGASVYWELRSDRTNWTSADLTLQYLPAELLVTHEMGLRLLHSPSVDGPFVEVPAIQDFQNNTLTTAISEPGFLVLGAGPVPEMIFSSGFE
ncbi:MAG: FG-GAP-like repeat-containing protein [Xanthomonadales bacterium]|nr:FG-GAP-like repeat-containing protein [Xanthomonadales bacterium]